MRVLAQLAVMVLGASITVAFGLEGMQDAAVVAVVAMVIGILLLDEDRPAGP